MSEGKKSISASGDLATQQRKEELGCSKHSQMRSIKVHQVGKEQRRSLGKAWPKNMEFLNYLLWASLLPYF